MGHKYSYNGPVMVHGKYVGQFQAETWAGSDQRAKSNIAYQAKQKMNIMANTKVGLPGKLKILY